MRNGEDLRVMKTKRAIREEFLQLLRIKNLDKITVVELCRAAEISKGTFYLHYEDVYSLYREVLMDYLQRTAKNHVQYGQILSNTEAFVMDFFSDRNLPEDEGRFLLKIDNVQYCHNLLGLLISSIADSIFASGILLKNEPNESKLLFLLGGMYALAMSLNTGGRKTISKAEEKYLVEQIRSSFV